MSVSANALPVPVPAAPELGEWGALPSLKRLVDFGLALVLLVVSLPVLVVVAVLVKATSRGPVLYRQTRLGRYGRPYTLYKIRTMVADSEKHGAVWCKPGDPRVTAVGRFLRKTHLDELPQLWNILRGHMSLVGPRPERPEFIPALAAAIPHYCERLRVRPGLTGLAQVQLAADTGLDSVRQKLTYDLWYLERCSLGLDLRIMAATALKLCGVRFGPLRRLCRFPAPEAAREAYLSWDVRPQEPASDPDIALGPVAAGSPLAPAFAPPLFLNSPEQA